MVVIIYKRFQAVIAVSDMKNFKTAEELQYISEK